MRSAQDKSICECWANSFHSQHGYTHAQDGEFIEKLVRSTTNYDHGSLADRAINRKGIIVQARMNSSRLPGKAMLKIGGVPSIEILFNRLKNLFGDRYIICLATSDEPSDDPLCDYVSNIGFDVKRGSLTDVCERFLTVAREYNLSHILRVTGDDLFRDFKRMNRLLTDNELLKYDYVYSDDLILGCNSELIRTRALEFINEFANNSANKDCLSWYLDNKRYFNSYEIVDEITRPAVSLMLDTESDLVAIQQFYRLAPDFFHTAWQYSELVEILSSNNGRCFEQKDRDVGLDLREKNRCQF